MKTARYIVMEGTEGVGKTTQTQKLVDYLTAKGYKVLQTKEPGTPLSPVTMKLREIMLSNEYDKDLTSQARELISQAIRSIHIEKVINPAREEYDFIIQDRGVLSGYSYGEACGNAEEMLEELSYYALNTMEDADIKDLYDDIVYLKGSVADGLERATTSKQEFTDGDAMESRGELFMERVSLNMDRYSKWFYNVKTIHMEGSTPDETFEAILEALELKDV